MEDEFEDGEEDGPPAASALCQLMSNLQRRCPFREHMCPYTPFHAIVKWPRQRDPFVTFTQIPSEACGYGVDDLLASGRRESGRGGRAGQSGTERRISSQGGAGTTRAETRSLFSAASPFPCSASSLSLVGISRESARRRASPSA